MDPASPDRFPAGRPSGRWRLERGRALALTTILLIVVLAGPGGVRRIAGNTGQRTPPGLCWVEDRIPGAGVTLIAFDNTAKPAGRFPGLPVATRAAGQPARLAAGGSLSGGAALALGMKIDLNTATAADLRLLPGIGPAMARRIIEERRAHGAFSGTADLARVRGVGDGLARRIGPWATADSGGAPEAKASGQSRAW